MKVTYFMCRVKYILNSSFFIKLFFILHLILFFYLKHFACFVACCVDGTIFGISGEADISAFEREGVGAHFKGVRNTHLDEIGKDAAVEFFGENGNRQGVARQFNGEWGFDEVFTAVGV